MKMTEKQLKLIEKYLDQDLSKDQKDQFELELKSANFREELLYQAKIIDTYKAIEIQNLRNKMEQISKGQTNNPNHRRTLLLLLGGTILICIVGAYFFFSHANTKGPKLFAEYYVELPPEVSNRSGETEQNFALQKAMQLYIDKDYKTALKSFETLNDKSDKTKLYETMCLIKLDKFTEASILLQKLKNSEMSAISQNADWYLCLARLQTDDIPSARKHVKEISSDPSHLFHRQAQKLMVELN